MGTEVLDSLPEEITKDPDLEVRQPLFRNAILWLLEAPDEVEVMSLIPYYSDYEDENEDDVKKVAEVAAREGPNYLHRHYIRGVARVPSADRRVAVAQALVTANRQGYGWAMCFDPHHAIRVTRGGQTANFLICFWCGNVLVTVPGERAVTYPIGKSAARLLRRELRRGGVGWLWFWRRWLP